MKDHSAREIGLLRTLSRGMEIRAAMSHEQLTQDFLREEKFAFAYPLGADLVLILQSAGDAFSDLSKCLFSRTPGMERGVARRLVQTELVAALRASFLGRSPETIGHDDVQSLHAHFDIWFAKLAKPRRVFVPCVVSPWAAPSFSVGSVTFTFIDEVANSDFYPYSEDPLGRYEFDKLISLMRDNRANWLASVPVDGCEHLRAEEVGALAVDLAIVGLQAAIPQDFGTRTMGRLDARRGAATRMTLSESGGYHNAGWHRTEAGLSIGTGTLADILQKTAPTISAVGACVTSFASGRYRLPGLERAWCDAAYWLHEALAEPIDTIAITKLETSLEVLLAAGNTPGSKKRLVTILGAFYGLRPSDALHSGTDLTADGFARNFVNDRSRILHGTWSTLNSGLSLNRKGAEAFVIAVIRRAASELENYAGTKAPADSIDAWLHWLSPPPL